MVVRVGGAVSVVILASSCGSWALAAEPKPLDVAAIRLELRQSWESLRSLQVRFKDFSADREGQQKPNTLHMDVGFAHAAGGLWSYNVRQTGFDGVENLITDVRQDGRKRHALMAFPGHADVIHRVSIQPQESTNESYAGGMHAILWLWIPGGKPPHAHLDSGGTLEVVREDGQAGRAVLTSSHKGYPVRMELDAEHDWLPSRVVLGDFDEYRATGFRRDNGRWFYEKGVETMNRSVSSGPTQRGFVVTDLQINRMIPTTTFSLPKLGPGVAIMDATPDAKPVRGTAKDREALERRYASPRPPTGEPAERIIAGRDPSLFPWRQALAIGSAALVVVAGLLMYRRAQ